MNARAIDEQEILDELIEDIRTKMQGQVPLTDYLRLTRELQKALATRARWKRGGKSGSGFKLPSV